MQELFTTDIASVLISIDAGVMTWQFTGIITPQVMADLLAYIVPWPLPIGVIIGDYRRAVIAYEASTQWLSDLRRLQSGTLLRVDQLEQYRGIADARAAQGLTRRTFTDAMACATWAQSCVARALVLRPLLASAWDKSGLPSRRRVERPSLPTTAVNLLALCTD